MSTISERLEKVAPTVAPSADGLETDLVVASKLDMVRELFRADRSRDAADLLDSMGDPRTFKDPRSTFRWITNRASINILDGNIEQGANGYREALAFAPDDGDAIANNVHATLLLESPEKAHEEATEALRKYPANKLLWALRMHAGHKIGLELADENIPPDIWDSEDVRYSYAHLLGSSGRHREAIAVIRKCLETSPDVLLYKREFLAGALSLATQEQVLAAFNHIDKKNLDNLKEAVSLFEPLEEVLYTQQSITISVELACNLSVALMLLKQNRRSAEISKQMLRKHPFEDALLRIQIASLDDDGQAASIKPSVEGREKKLTTGALIILLDIAITAEDWQWVKQIDSELNVRSISDREHCDVEALRYREKLAGKQRSETLSELRALLADEPHRVHLVVIAAEALTQDELRNDAKAIIKSCINACDISELSDFHLVHLAQQAFKLSELQIAAVCLERVVRHPAADDLTRRLLLCYIKLGHRAKAWDLLDQMPDEARDSPNIMRAECELCQLSSDWNRLIRLSNILIDSGDDHIGAILAHAGALHRIGKQDLLKEFLLRDWQFSEADPRYSFELAKLEVAAGLPNFALRRLVVQLAREPENAEVAGQLIMLRIMVATEVPPDQPLAVGTSTAVDLVSDLGHWTVVIERKNFPTSGWTEVVYEESAAAQMLIGASTGDVRVVIRGLSEQTAVVGRIRSIVEFAAEKAAQVLARANDHMGPMWQIPAYKHDGGINIDALADTARRAAGAARIALAGYKDRGIPLAAVARILGQEMATFNLRWPGDEHALWVSSGTVSENWSALETIGTYKNRFAIDLFTLTELVRWDVFDEVTSTLGQLFLPQSARDQIQATVEHEKRFPASGHMGEHMGKLRFHKVSALERRQWQSHLKRLKSAADRCKVVASRGASNASEEMSSLEDYLDPGTVDSIHLCLTNDLALLTDDLALRNAGSLTGIGSAIALQPALVAARDSGLLSQKKYTNAIVGKICANHQFVSISSRDLLITALNGPRLAKQQVIDCLRSFKRQDLEMSSGFRVALLFIRGIAGQIPSNQVAIYAHEALSALVDARPNLKKPAEQLFARIIHVNYGRNGRRLSPSQRRAFGRIIKRTIAFPRS
ncbi:tetratricopeptide repeat protein [Xanthomonas arboricola]|uniref:tetratricopeptide repeat protein n=1 Tax=Xanthomonas arboricola TaxID=56448 RepID=UPI00129039E9|nr:hypothetical protein [Xanthomonas arboricola]